MVPDYAGSARSPRARADSCGIDRRRAAAAGHSNGRDPLMVRPGAAAPRGPTGEPRFWPWLDPDDALARGPVPTAITGEDGWEPPTQPTLYGVGWRPPPNPHDVQQTVARLCNLPARDGDTDIIGPTLPPSAPTMPHLFLLERVLGALREL